MMSWKPPNSQLINSPDSLGHVSPTGSQTATPMPPCVQIQDIPPKIDSEAVYIWKAVEEKEIETYYIILLSSNISDQEFEYNFLFNMS